MNNVYGCNDFENFGPSAIGDNNNLLLTTVYENCI